MSSTAVDVATAAVDLAPTEPRRAQLMLAGIAEEAGTDPEIGSMAERAAGLAAMGRGDAAAAARHLRTAVELAERAGLRHRAAEARTSLTFVLFMTGDTAGALRAADRAARDLRGLPAARLAMQRALVVARLGRLDEALDSYRGALRVFRRAGDRRWEVKLRMNRGWLHAYRGDWRAAETDLRRAEQLSLELGDDVAAAGARHNLGFVAALRGDVPAALALYDDVDERFRAAGVYRGQLQLDRAEVLLSVRLADEARRAAAEAVAEATRRRMLADLAEARLMLARAALLEGDLRTASDAADRARRGFARQQRAAWAALARHVALRIDWQAGTHTPATLRTARRTTAALAAAGWVVAALDARLVAARVALELGQDRTARRELALAARARRVGPADLRARAWHAEALLRLAEGDRRGAQTGLRAGLRVLERFRATLGASELRAQVSGHASELAQLGLRLALQDGRARAVLEWSERWRAGALRLRPVRPPDDRALADRLAQLRRVVAELDQAAFQGRLGGSLLRRQAELEEDVRRRAHHARGTWAPHRAATLRELRAGLGERALVEYVECDGALHAVVVAGGRVRLRDLGARTAVERELESLRFALRRRTYRGGSERAGSAAAQAGAVAARRLDALLIQPVRGDCGDRELVLVPTGTLHALPWSALPSIATRPTAVAPSAWAWLQAVSGAAGSERERVVLAAGPGLSHAGPEIAALARRYPEAERFSGRRARVSVVLAALERARTAHIAAHGRFRADNPLFSCLQLADGPLTVHDLEGLGRAPELLVLSACDSGLSEVCPGDELMGLASALFALGTRTLIASVVPVADAATRRLMVALHRHLRDGLAPARALALAHRDTAGREEDGLAAAGFVCFGAGWAP